MVVGRVDVEFTTAELTRDDRSSAGELQRLERRGEEDDGRGPARSEEEDRRVPERQPGCVADFFSAEGEDQHHESVDRGDDPDDGEKKVEDEDVRFFSRDFLMLEEIHVLGGPGSGTGSGGSRLRISP